MKQAVKQKIMVSAAVAGLFAAGVASADVCYFKIESLDWDRLAEEVKDPEAIADPNFDAVSNAELDAVSAQFQEEGEAALETAPGLYAGSSMSRGIWYRKAPCEISSVEDLADYYDAPYRSGLRYTFEQVDEAFFERANGPGMDQCEECYTVDPSRQQ